MDRDRVKLITVTPDAEDLVVYMARVSNPSNQSNNQGSEKLIKYLINHKHWSPFEMVHMVLEINTTRSISAQILRHRSFSFQEFSQRYADTEAIGYAKAPHLRRQDLTNRQNSIDDLDTAKTQIYYRRIGQLFEEAQDLYREMVSSGVAKECAREVLPLATPTRMYMAGTARSFLHYIELRTGNGTQLEHKLIAEEIKAIFCKEFPATSTAMNWKQ
jgi:thymidylate synthase (FAD)